VLGRLIRRNPTKRGVGRTLVKVSETWEAAMVARSVDRPEWPEYYTLGIRCSSAAATVALGPLLTVVEDKWRGAEMPATEVQAIEDAVTKGLMCPQARARDLDGPLIEFANCLERPGAVEACYRVVVWAYLTSWVPFIWSDPEEYEAGVWHDEEHQYDEQMDRFEEIFGVDGPHERAVRDAGRRLVGPASDDDRAAWEANRLEGCLNGMIAAALAKPDTHFGPLSYLVLSQLGEPWIDQWSEGSKVLAERLDQLAPEGLPGPDEVWAADMLQQSKGIGEESDRLVQLPLSDELAQQIREAVEARLNAEWQMPASWSQLGIDYTNSREDVNSEEDAYAFTDALVFGYALREVESARSDGHPVPADVAARLKGLPDDGAGLLEALLDLVGTWTEPSTSRLPEIFTLTGEGWSDFEYWAHQYNVSRSRARYREAVRAAGSDMYVPPSMVDYTHAMWFGYALCCCAEARGA
jgi:hypothetical protein